MRRWRRDWEARNGAWLRVTAKKFKADLWRKYRMRWREHEGLYVWQGGRCACCWQAPATAVDHCHRTNGVRALLCQPCNRMLGQANDNPARLRAGAAYLERNPT